MSLVMRLINSGNACLSFLVFLSCFFIVPASFASDAVTLGELLDRVKQGSVLEKNEQAQREQRFLEESQQQAKLLEAAIKTRTEVEARSAELEKIYDANEKLITDKTRHLNERLGVLKELFGTVQAVAGDLKANMEVSVISAQYPGRTGFLDNLIEKMGSETQLASVSELEQLWYLLQQEMTESGRTVEFATSVVQPDGTRQQKDVVRVGSFNLVSEGEYLHFDNATGTLLVLPSQPASRYTSSAGQLQSATSGFTRFGVDPTGPAGGALLEALIDLPDIPERISQGRVVGYIIIALGIVALLVALWRLIALRSLDAGIAEQLKNPTTPLANNPLGRVLSVHRNYRGANTETLELKLHEAVLREIPQLEKWINFIKITAMVAPLLGLLGTVTGMILTFQALTIFGSSDPQAMAGGISSALVTTVLGLCVAIPMLFLHSLVQGSSKRIIHVLEQQAAGIIAEQAERTG